METVTLLTNTDGIDGRSPADNDDSNSERHRWLPDNRPDRAPDDTIRASTISEPSMTRMPPRTKRQNSYVTRSFTLYSSLLVLSIKTSSSRPLFERRGRKMDCDERDRIKLVEL